MNISIKNIPPETVEKIDGFAKKEGLSRNALLVKIIEMYVSCNEKVIAKYLPPIVRSLVTDELERLELSANSAVNNIYLSSKKLLDTANKIDSILAPAIENESKSSDDFDDLTALLNRLDTVY